MLAFLVSLLAIFGFIATLAYLRVLIVVHVAVRQVRSGVLAMFDNRLDDAAKEAAVQSAGLALLKGSFQIFWRLVFCLFAAAAPVYLASAAGLVTADVVFQLLLRLDYLIILSLVTLAVAILWRLVVSTQSSGSAYSSADQVVHNLAFSRPGIQLTAADIEDRLFVRKIEATSHNPPVFITSLPRAGTTILLTALNELPEVASHLYRDMPFVMAPLLWARLSGIFTKPAELQERAHGDGIKIGYDSPEAFEEVIWRAFWPKKYTREAIPLWQEKDLLPEAEEFMERHFRKIIALRTQGEGRYVSKNNANLARLDLLPEMFPSCRVVVPVREPAEHAASLLRQHCNFKRQHQRDPFVQRYMHDIGHLEFGELHKPFLFPGFDPTASTPEDPGYWLDYWIAAYRWVLKRAGGLYLVDQNQLTQNPQKTMHRLCEYLDLVPGNVDFSHHFRRIAHKADESVFDAAKLGEANSIYQELVRSGI